MTTPALQQLLNQLPQRGEVRWLSVRPDRRAAVVSVEAVMAKAGSGLVGDHYRSFGGKRQVTLLQWEHLPAIAAMLGRDKIEPELLRRNLAVSGINLLALKDKHFSIGAAVFEFTGLAHPCSRMEEIFGAGGYNAVRGHGGITARVVSGGVIRLGDGVAACAPVVSLAE